MEILTIQQYKQRMIVDQLDQIEPERIFITSTLPRDKAEALAEEIRKVLARAIDSGGTTLRDFIGGDGKPGYFQQELFVYGRAGQLCKLCGTTLSECRLGQRSSVFCRHCQS